MSVSLTVPAPHVAGRALLTKQPDDAPFPAAAACEPLATPDEKRLLQVLLWTLKPLINLRGSIPLPFVTTFLMVALDEGQGVSTYARNRRKSFHHVPLPARYRRSGSEWRTRSWSRHDTD